MAPALSPCPACGGALQRWREATASDPQLAGRLTFELARCVECETGVTLDPPSAAEVPALYEGGSYAPVRGRAERLIAPLRRLADRDRMRFMRGLGTGASVLEIGAGDGSFVARMRATGLHASGIEPSAPARVLAAGRGVELEPGGGEEEEGVAAPVADTDAVVIWHALEHMADPAAAIASARERLRPGGRLVVAVPNLGSLQARIGGDRWFHQDVPRHRTHFTVAGLGRLLERHGFEPPRVSHLLVEQNALGMWQTLLNRITGSRNVAFRALKRDLDFPSRGAGAVDLTVTAIAALPLAVLAPLLEIGAGIGRRGGTIVAVTTPSRP